MTKSELKDKIKDIFLNTEQQFGRKILYQSFDDLNIRGQRNTRKRLEIYKINDIINENMEILNIGSNLGFLDFYLSKKVKLVTSVEYNESLTNIHKLVNEYFNVNNVEVHNCKIQNFKLNKKYDLVLSLAIHRWVGYTNEELVDYYKKALKKDGYLLLESQDMKNDTNYSKIKDLLSGDFSCVFEDEYNEKKIRRKFSLWKYAHGKHH